MSRSRAGKTFLRSLLTPVIGVGLVGYFAYHTVQGNRGVLSLVGLMSETARAHETLEELRSERLALEARVNALSPAHLDLDLLEEQARFVLNVGHEDELVLFLPELEPSGSEAPLE
ncbi:MAG: septum formation initiator family protein [Pseudomonadota bacterium]